jgi:hypothetical protein
MCVYMYMPIRLHVYIYVCEYVYMSEHTYIYEVSICIYVFAEMEAKLLSVADTLGARKASTLARAMAQQVCTLPQIIYPLQFYSFSEAQHDTLTRLLLRPLRQAKVVDTRLHEEVMTNQLLEGFMADVHTKVQEAKLRLFNLAMAKGGDTRRAMECLCLRLLRQDKKDLVNLSLIAFCERCWVPEKEPPPGSGRNGGRSPWCGGLSSIISRYTPFRSRTKGARYITVPSLRCCILSPGRPSAS